jgi:ATP-binding cassette subfamily B protein
VSRTRGVLGIAKLAWHVDRPRTALALVLAVAEGAAKGMNALVLKLVADAVIDGSTAGATRAATLAALLGGCWYASDWFGGMVRANLREKVDVEVDARLLEQTLTLPGLAHHESPAFADQLRLLSERRDELVDVVPALARVVFALALAASVTSLLVSLDARLVVLPVVGLAIVAATFRSERRWERMHRDLAQPWRQTDHLWELVSSPAITKELLVFGITPELRHRYVASWRPIQRRMDRDGVAVTAMATLGWVAFAGGFAVAIALVASGVSRRGGLGDLVLAISLAAQVSDHVSTGADILARFLRASRAAARLAWLDDQRHDPAQPSAPARPAALPTRVTDGIDLRGVTFRYPGTSAVVLDHVDLHLPAGATVALVGENGAGKTTIGKLLLRYYDPSEGAVTVDGTDLRAFDPAGWRAMTSAAFQDAVPFEFTALDTIGLGRVDDDGVTDAIEAAGAGRVVGSLPDGVATPLGRSLPGGVELSGGQWQHLALARGVVRDDPLLLLLDEPASALDPEAEHDLLQRARAATRATAARGGVTLLVSHRFTTVRFADLVCVLEHGRVAELGTHDELLAHGRRYAELYRLQADSYR